MRDISTKNQNQTIIKGPGSSGRTIRSDNTKIGPAGGPGADGLDALSLTPADPWDNSTTYAEGTILTHLRADSGDGGIYFSMQDNNTNHSPGDGAPWWQLIGEAGEEGPQGPAGDDLLGAVDGMKLRHGWAAALSYVVNDLVTYNGAVYACIDAHTSASGNKPGSGGGKWAIFLPRGKQGIKGNKGNTGNQGNKGNQGDQGEKGEKGDKGDKGDAGTNGTDGDPGGPPGPAGADGADGEQGPAGADGEDGPQGPAGSGPVTTVSDGFVYEQTVINDYPHTFANNGDVRTYAKRGSGSSQSWDFPLRGFVDQSNQLGEGVGTLVVPAYNGAPASNGKVWGLTAANFLDRADFTDAGGNVANPTQAFMFQGDIVLFCKTGQNKYVSAGNGGVLRRRNTSTGLWTVLATGVMDVCRTENHIWYLKSEATNNVTVYEINSSWANAARGAGVSAGTEGGREINMVASRHSDWVWVHGKSGSLLNFRFQAATPTIRTSFTESSRFNDCQYQLEVNADGDCVAFQGRSIYKYKISTGAVIEHADVIPDVAKNGTFPGNICQMNAANDVYAVGLQKSNNKAAIYICTTSGSEQAVEFTEDFPTSGTWPELNPGLSRIGNTGIFAMVRQTTATATGKQTTATIVYRTTIEV